MSDLDLVVPFALVDPALAPDLLRDQSLPNLARVLARATPATIETLPPDAALTPWQDWILAKRAGVSSAAVNVAEVWASVARTGPASPGRRWLAEPAHFQIANDHLRLDDPRRLAITSDEARALAAAAAPVLADAGWRLAPAEPATPTHWLAVRDDDVALSGASIERAIGDNVAAWQPRGAEAEADDGGGAALAWRRCVNEIQMLWFGHPVNDARDAAGRPAINTLWLSGNGAPATASPRYDAIESGLPLVASLSTQSDAGRALATFDRFVDPARNDDWSGWRAQLEAFDARLGELVARQSEGTLGTVTLVLCGRDRRRVATWSRRDLGRFWRGFGTKPSLADTFADGSGERA